MRTLGLLVTLALGLVSTPLSADAQPPARVPRIGLLRPGSPPDPFVEEFRQGLRDLGYVEGQNVVIEERYARGNPDRLADLAAALVRLKVDVLVPVGLAGTRAAKQATATIPIVFAGTTDPVGSGLVASLARPGGNLPGVTIGPPELAARNFTSTGAAPPRGLATGAGSANVLISANCSSGSWKADQVVE